MSTKIKNTLFRFATMRTPELLEDEKIKALFVRHPEEDKDLTAQFDSIFLQAAYHVPQGSTKKSALNSTVLSFATNALKKDKSLYESELISKDFFDFAIWLTKNRTQLNLEKIQEKTIVNSDGIVGPMPKFQALDNETLKTLWDNLFYQIITYKSNYVREAILSVLVADFFIKNQNNIEQTDKELQKLAQARVVIPKVLFEKEDTTAQKQELQQLIDALPVATKELDKELQLYLVQELIEAQKASVNELKKAQAVYNKQNQKAYELALNTYNETVADLYANAEKVERVITDPITNQQTTVTEFVDLVIPSFSFVKAPELQTTALQTSKVSTPTVSQVEQLIQDNEFETFDEVIEHLENTIQTATQFVLENTNVSETYVSSNGVILPVVDAVSSPTFSIAASSQIGSSPVKILFSDSIAHQDIVSASYTITFDDETSVSSTSFTDTISSNKLYINAFTNKLSYFDKAGFTINGTLTRADGSKIEFSGTGVIQENILGLNKIVPIDGGVTTYDLTGNGKYTLVSAISSGNGDSDGSDTGGSSTGSSGSTSGNVINFIPSGFGIKRLGILDYRKVEQEVCCYVPGEVSHIENIMASEYKDRTTRSLQRREETNSSTTEVEREKLTDTTTSNRFEMNQEVSSLLAEDTHFGANVNASYSIGKTEGPSGLFGLNASADFATNTTKEESNNQAVTMAKEVTERALDRVVQKVKEERIVKITNEFEETNTHGFDNRKNPFHISGVYRWIDKVYRNQVVNYGKRLMYEFMIPEPAAFHNLAKTTVNSSGEILVKPIDPREVNIKTISDLDWTKAAYWASQFNAVIDECPDMIVKYPITFSEENLGLSSSDGQGLRSGSKHFDLKIPEKYQALSVKGKISVVKGFFTGFFTNQCANVTVGNTKIPFDFSSWAQAYLTSDINLDFKPDSFIEKIPVSLIAWDIKGISGNLIATCQLTPEAYNEWQLKTFNAIIQAYEIKLEEYNQKLKQLKSEIKGTNPGFYRQIENMVLRKNCIEYLNSFELTGKGNLLKDPSDATKFHVEYDSPELEAYAARVKFFEQAFEWNLMSYNFYPMYWGDKAKLQAKYNVEEFNDPTFRAFLQSGMARVMVTVRPGFEEAVNWYMQTGQIWNGGQVPTSNDPLFLSIIDELRELEGTVEETWETRVPTSLTVIQAGSIGLDVQGLPCDDDCADYKLFDSDGQPVLDGNGKQMSTNPIVQTNAVLGNNIGDDGIGSGGPGPNPDPFAGQNQVM